MGDIKNKMKNCILVVNYTFAKHAGSASFLRNLYKDYFKKIIFYSDVEEEINTDDDINFVNTNKGEFSQNIFWHLWENYVDDINSADGLFYTMDDCIINLSDLHTYDHTKAIFTSGEKSATKPLSDLPDRWWWTSSKGKRAISNLESSLDFKDLKIDGYTGCYADYFYIPKRYLNELFFRRMRDFGNAGIFHELAIPSVIHNTINSEDDYQPHNYLALWTNRAPLKNKDSFLSLFTKEREADKKINFEKDWNNSFKNIVVHPIKLSNEKYKDWLLEIT